jgi:hypothetical protein
VISFAANGSPTTAAEACTSVNLGWSATIVSCAGTNAIVRVSMLRDGQPFRPTLAPSGMLTVSDAEDATYTLHAHSHLGALSCGVAEQGVTIFRDKRLRLAPVTQQCIDTQQTVSLDVTASVPAPPGGLSITVSSSDPARIAGTSVILEEGAAASWWTCRLGARCGPVTLTDLPRPGLVVEASCPDGCQ